MFKEVDVKTFDLEIFNKLNKEWALLSAGNKDAFNTMTISWGEMGTLWNKPVMTCFVRPQRYTKEFIDSNNKMTLSFFNGNHMKDLTVLGRESGRDGDKIAKTDLTPTFIEGLPTFEEANIVVVGKKLGSLTVVSIFSLTKSLKTLIISMLLSFFVVKFVKFNVGICRNV